MSNGLKTNWEKIYSVSENLLNDEDRVEKFLQALEKN
jgi:hypothetical protein